MDPAENIIDVVCHFHCSLRYDAECKTNVHPCGRYDVLCQTLFSVWALAFDSERRSRTRKEEIHKKTIQLESLNQKGFRLFFE